jgi:hypothetical protein
MAPEDELCQRHCDQGSNDYPERDRHHFEQNATNVERAHDNGAASAEENFSEPRPDERTCDQATDVERAQNYEG